MEFVNMLYNSLLCVSRYILVFFVLLHCYRLFFYKEVFKEFKEGLSLYFFGFIKAQKNYKIQLLSSLFILSNMPFYMKNVFFYLTNRDFFFLKVFGLIIVVYLSDVIFSYMLLGCYDLLKKGKVQYRPILLRTREIGKKIVCFSLLSAISMYPLLEHISIITFQKVTVGYQGPFFLAFSCLPFRMLVLLLLIPWQPFLCYFLLFSLIDQEFYRKAVFSSMRFFYKSIPLYLGLQVSNFFLYLLFEIILGLILFLLQYVYPQLFSSFLIVKPIFSFYIRQLLALGEYIAIVSYWLYSRKKQTVPFGKEYIESLEG